MTRLPASAAAAALALALLAGPAAAAVDCAAAPAEAQALRKDEAALQALFDAVQSCDTPTVRAVGDPLGRLRFNMALKAGDPAARRALLEAAVQTIEGHKWRAHAALGQVYEQDARWGDAALQFELALNWLSDHPEAAPGEEAVKRLVAKANASRALRPAYTRALRTRAGTPGGVALRSVAGVEIEEVPFPIEFAYDSDVVGPENQEALADLVEIIRAEGLSEIILVGHTDPEGSDAYNLELSLRRAKAVGALLLKAGIPVTIRVRGAGEGEPPVIDDPSLYSKDELHRIMRRVVLDRRG